MALTRIFWGANSTAMERVIGGGVAIAAGNAHQRDVGRHVDDRSATRFGDRRNAEAAAEEGAEQIEFDDAPEFLDRGVDDGVVHVGRSAGVVVQNVQRAVMVHCRVDRGLHAGLVGDIGRHGDAVAAGLDDQLRGLFTGLLVEFGDDDFGALGRHGFGGGAADARARTGDEGDLTRQTWHRFSSTYVGSFIEPA
jgi:hypothetical protein